MTGYEARICKCGHHEGAHNMGRPHGSRPARAGVCLYPNCGCRAFVEEDRFEARQQAWLTDMGDAAA